MVPGNIVQVCAGFRLRVRLMRGPVCGRGNAKHISKCPRKRFVGFKTSLKSDFRDGMRRSFQAACSSLQAQPLDVLLQGLAGEAAKDAVKMEPGKRRHGGQAFEV